jgi:hypothetical protein
MIDVKAEKLLTPKPSSQSFGGPGAASLRNLMVEPTTPPPAVAVAATMPAADGDEPLMVNDWIAEAVCLT